MKKTTLFVVALLIVAFLSGPVFADGVKKSRGQEVVLSLVNVEKNYTTRAGEHVPLEAVSNARIFNVDKNKSITITSAILYKYDEGRTLVEIVDYLEELGPYQLEPFQDFFMPTSFPSLPFNQPFENPLTLIISWVSTNGELVTMPQIEGRNVHHLSEPLGATPVTIVKVTPVIISEGGDRRFFYFPNRD